MALDSALLSAPVGSLIPVALEALDRGGTLAVAGIYVDEVPHMPRAAVALLRNPANARMSRRPPARKPSAVDGVVALRGHPGVYAVASTYRNALSCR